MLDQLVSNTRELIENRYYSDNSANSIIEKQSELPKFRPLLNRGFTILGEIKPGSPTQGKIYGEKQLEEKILDISRIVDGISVLTEPNYFHGALDNLSRVEKLSNGSKPILMKDFIIDKVQFEYVNTSAILLIDRILEDRTKQNLISNAHDLNFEVILEVDNESDFLKNLDSKAEILAINNRNLDTMVIDHKKSQNLVLQYSPERPILGLSGYTKPEEVIEAYESGVAGVLLGTVLSKSDNPEKFINQIRTEIAP